jgi:hypothetical protein
VRGQRPGQLGQGAVGDRIDQRPPPARRAAAARDPRNSDDLRRKAEQLERAARQIEADASRRDRFLVLNERS